jgi:hypothetical protein
MDNFHWVAAAVLTVLATARITRLIVWDTYPPSVWLRIQWDKHTNDSWGELVHCGYCAGVYVAAAVVLSGWLSDWHTAWWIVTGVLSAAYLGAITMAYDGDED